MRSLLLYPALKTLDLPVSAGHVAVDRHVTRGMWVNGLQ
jgi:hypothetical protein